MFDPAKFRIIPRVSWANTRVCKQLPALRLPVSHVLFTYHVDPLRLVKTRRSRRTKPDPEYLECVSELRKEDDGSVTVVKDIRYNFMIAPGGHVFEGRGWFKRPALPSRFVPLRTDALYVAYLGNFKKSPPSKEQFDARFKLMLHGVKYRYIKKKCFEITCNRN